MGLSVLGWGLYRTYSTIRHIKDNIRTLQEQNFLQQDQIIELSHYLNVVFAFKRTKLGINFLKHFIKTLSIMKYSLAT